MKTKADATVGRRDFLNALGAGTTLAAVSAAPLSIAAQADSEKQQ
ncbi:MAG: twin-arginine translocation signal domain-containing protein [Pseudorhodoplanes sp.]|nr:twin-arginine translocation signal domain-containing protein [Pseudorhodoplanes sp.]